MEEQLTEARISEDNGELVRDIPAENLITATGAREVMVPYGGSEYVCPQCEQKIPTRKQRNMSKPAKYAHMLNDVMKCPYCSFCFSYRTRAVVLKS